MSSNNGNPTGNSFTTQPSTFGSSFNTSTLKKEEGKETTSAAQPSPAKPAFSTGFGFGAPAATVPSGIQPNIGNGTGIKHEKAPEPTKTADASASSSFGSWENIDKKDVPPTSSAAFGTSFGASSTQPAKPAASLQSTLHNLPSTHPEPAAPKPASGFGFASSFGSGSANAAPEVKPPSFSSSFGAPTKPSEPLPKPFSSTTSAVPSAAPQEPSLNFDQPKPAPVPAASFTSSFQSKPPVAGPTKTDSPAKPAATAVKESATKPAAAPQKQPSPPLSESKLNGGEQKPAQVKKPQPAEAKQKIAEPAKEKKPAAPKRTASEAAAAPLRQSSRQRKAPVLPTVDAPIVKAAGKIEIPSGSGAKFEDIPHLAKELEKRKSADKAITALHRILFGRPGESNKRKANLRKFNGTDADLSEKLSKQTADDLKALAVLLNLERSGEKSALTDRIAAYLREPKDLGASKPAPKKTPSTVAKNVPKTKSGIKKAAVAKPKAAPKKKASGGKPKAKTPEMVESEEEEQILKELKEDEAVEQN